MMPYLGFADLVQGIVGVRIDSEPIDVMDRERHELPLGSMVRSLGAESRSKKLPI